MDKERKIQVSIAEPVNEALSDVDCEISDLDLVAQVRELMPDDAIMFDLADFFKVFGDSTRIRILWALDSAEEMCVCDLAELLNMTKSAISHQLRSLRQTKLVKYRKEGKNVYYSLDDEHVSGIMRVALIHIQELQKQY